MMHGYPPVPLENRCRRDISARDRERGYTYFRQGRVRLSHLLPTAALAVVEGTDYYFVAVEGEAAAAGGTDVASGARASTGPGDEILGP